MVHHAATATLPAATHSIHLPVGVLLLLLLGLGWAIGHLFLCWISPFTGCRHCSGSGRRPARIGRGVRFCRPCDGSGYRLRHGRHVLNYLRSTYDRASK